jgi:uncharacterized membrane protein YphA (DoxX/SURF4 family)
MKRSKTMNTTLLIIRWVVGILFIFSGLIKANDPLGLSYKMQEFFDAWHMTYLNDYALPLALVMNVFEVLAGVAIIIGWQIRLFSRLLLLLIIFFTFLTGYATYSGKFRSCGCFGDCVPLTPLQSFIKDVILLILIIILFANRKRIPQAFNNVTLPVFILLFTVVGVALFESYVLTYLPVLDCLPYRMGNNLIEQMQPPKGSVTDSTQLMFVYKKAGKEVRFDQDHFPEDFNDSSYQYIDRYEKLIRKGNDTPPISDFSLKTSNGTDTTQAILHLPRYILLFVQNFSNWNKQGDNYEAVDSVSKHQNVPLFVITPLPEVAKELLPQADVLQCDATVLKTAARVNGTYYVMQGPVVKQKASYVNSEKVVAALEKK